MHLLASPDFTPGPQVPDGAPLPERAERAIWEGRTARRREAPSTGRGWASCPDSARALRTAGASSFDSIRPRAHPLRSLPPPPAAALDGLGPRLRPPIEPFPRLLPKLPRPHHLPQDHRRPELLPHLAVEVLQDREPHVQPHEVRQLQRPHRVPVPELHRPIDVHRRRHPGLQHPHRLGAERHPQPARREAGRVVHHDRRLAQAPRHRERRRHRRLLGLEPPHHLEQLHHRRRVEEVKADRARPRPETAAELRDAQARRVRREQRPRRRRRLRPAEHLHLEVHLLGHRLDHEIGVRRRAREIRRRDEHPDHLAARLVEHLALLHEAIGRALDVLDRRADARGVDVVEARHVAGDRRDLRDPLAHRARAEHEHRAHPRGGVVHHRRAHFGGAGGGAFEAPFCRPSMRLRTASTSWGVSLRRFAGPGAAAPSARPCPARSAAGRTAAAAGPDPGPVGATGRAPAGRASAPGAGLAAAGRASAGTGRAPAGAA
ncbi:uncharacterized protein SOCE836_093710 [Sorangium cellulosum]|uniref:Uncharacterized protein n=1 Tax=Sorangium cellulosum TaxID=56 RepID=A0A4P2R2E1_SORCE|nr:uncharacterized protein SOCE836_093710 [Sorangium cellulosum]